MKRIKLFTLAIIFTCSLISAQTKLGLGITGGYAAPTGDFGDLYKSGFSGIASFTYDLSDRFQLSANAGYSQFSFNNDKFNELLTAFFGADPKVNVDSKLKIIPVLIGAKYFIAGTTFRPYAAVDIGLHIVSASASKVTVGGQTLDATKEESKSAAAWGVGVGFLYQVAPKINIDVNAKINGNSMEAGSDMSASGPGYSASSSSKSTIAFFTISAGLLFEL